MTMAKTVTAGVIAGVLVLVIQRQFFGTGRANAASRPQSYVA